MLQRRHYELIASALHDARQSVDDQEQHIIDVVESELINRLAANNPRFNAERFKKASA